MCKTHKLLSLQLGGERYLLELTEAQVQELLVPKSSDDVTYKALFAKRMRVETEQVCIESMRMDYPFTDEELSELTTLRDSFQPLSISYEWVNRIINEGVDSKMIQSIPPSSTQKLFALGLNRRTYHEARAMYDEMKLKVIAQLEALPNVK